MKIDLANRPPRICSVSGLPLRRRQSRSSAAFTLAELVVAIAIAAMVMGGLINGYIQSARRAEWSAYSLAAQSLAMQRLEQARACTWDPLGYPAVDELVATNFPVQINILDIPISKTNIVYATNTTTIKFIATNPPLKMITVNCTWNFMRKRNFTNSVATYRAPNQ